MSSVSNGVADIYFRNGAVWAMDYHGVEVFNADKGINFLTDEAIDYARGMEGDIKFEGVK